MQKPFDERFKEIADSMGIALYQRFSLHEASLFLHCPVSDIKSLTKQSRLDYIQVTDSKIEFFGYQLLSHLLSSVKATPSSGFQSAPDKIIRTKEVQKLTGLSRTTIWREERKGKFPARVPLSAGSVGWRLSEVEAWIQSRAS